jgi:hypothetical protein
MGTDRWTCTGIIPSHVRPKILAGWGSTHEAHSVADDGFSMVSPRQLLAPGSSTQQIPANAWLRAVSIVASDGDPYEGNLEALQVFLIHRLTRCTGCEQLGE